MKTFVYMDDNLIGDWCKSWRVTQQKKMASLLFIGKGPSIGWTYRLIYRADSESLRRSQNI